MNTKKTILIFEKNPEEIYTVTLKDMKEHFKDRPFVEEILKKQNPSIYNVYIKKFPPINLGLTEINHGTINKEFYMTRGHIHSEKTPEFYVLLEGSGIVLLQKNEPKTIKLKKGEITLIPEGFVHRLINIGKKKLKVLTIYHEDSKPNYKIKFKKRLFKSLD